MNLRTKTHNTFKLTVSKKELTVIELALALMYENDHTHENWIKVIEPLLADMMDALELENEYGL